RRVILDSKESWLIICDSQLGHLMRSMFQGRRFIQLDLEALKGGHDIHNAVRNRLWTWNKKARALTMSEMVVMFGYIYRQLRPSHLASEMRVNIKTVNTFLYSGLAKNGLKRSSVRLLAISENKRIGHYSGAGQGNHAGGDTGCG
ncbi:hypothetical protein ABG677_004896, partial [Escherichia coli]